MACEVKACMSTVLGLVKISLNGVDNVGKTCQLRYVPEFFEVRNGIHEHDEYLGSIAAEGRLSKWWLEESSDEEVVRVLTRAAIQRAALPTKSGFVIFDQGGVMFKSVCIAMIAVRRGCDLAAAQEIYELVQKQAFPVEDVRILLKHGKNVDESIAISLSREKDHNEKYAQYRQLLQEQMERQTGKYTHVLNVTGMSVVQVQNQIRAIVRSCVSGKMPGGLGPMFEGVEAIVAFDGMSEAGKSTVAMGTCARMESLGVRSTRLKIGYFMDIISAKLGVNSYEFSEEKQAQLLVKELDRYLSSHYWNKVATLESLYQLGCTEALKEILGDLLNIVYLEASHRVRMQGGADKIKHMPSCMEVDNDSSALVQKMKVGISAYREKAHLFSDSFVLSAGTVLIHKTQGKVCIIQSQGERQAWLLPKGRKNIGESLAEAAVRETYEETGYRCSLMRLTMCTRATLGNDAEDVVREVSGVCEPLMVSLREGAAGQKLVFWYVAQVDESKERTEGTQKANEIYKVGMYPPKEASELLQHPEEGALVLRAYDLFEREM